MAAALTPASWAIVRVVKLSGPLLNSSATAVFRIRSFVDASSGLMSSPIKQCLNHCLKQCLNDNDCFVKCFLKHPISLYTRLMTFNLQIFLSTFVMIFLAELGDKTQISTFAFASEAKSPFSVFIGAALA